MDRATVIVWGGSHVRHHRSVLHAGLQSTPTGRPSRPRAARTQGSRFYLDRHMAELLGDEHRAQTVRHTELAVQAAQMGVHGAR